MDLKRQTDHHHVTARAYAVVPDDEEYIQEVAVALDYDKPFHVVSSAYAHLPEAQGLSWTDDFFDDEPADDIVAVFDLDYELMESYYESIGWSVLAVLLFFPNLLVLSLMGMVPCYLRPNVQWSIRAQHVCITRDGIRFVRDRRPTCWGQSCTDAGKFSKTVPFDKITDCDIVEPAGKTCCWIPNTLYTLNIDTASADKGQHELSICGLKNPLGFKRLVWAMKRTYHPSVASLPNALKQVSQAFNARNEQGEDVTTLLREIRDELRVNNEALMALKQPPAGMATAPVDAKTVI